MPTRKKHNVFRLAEEQETNYDKTRNYALSWDYGRLHGMPLWLESISEKTWLPGMEYARHNPINVTFEIILSGSMHIMVDGQNYLVKEKEFMILHPGIPNKMKTGPCKSCRKLLICFCGTILSQLLPASHLHHAIPMKIADEKKIVALFERARILISRQDTNDVPALSALALEIITEFSMQCATTLPLMIANAIYIMNFNLGRKIKLKEIADELNVSDKQLLRVFNRELQMTPMQYLIKLRMDKAESLLLNTRMTVNEIASQVGYLSTSRFIQDFKKRFGHSPGAFRKQ